MTRLVAFYVCSAGAISCMPYLSVLLSESGLPDSWVGLALAVFPVGLLGASPVWAWLADQRGSPVAVLWASTIFTVVSALALAMSSSGLGMAVALLPLAVGRAPQLPIADSITLGALRDPTNYGRIRATGSAAFLVLVLLGGWLRESYPRAPLWISLLMAVGAVLAVWGLPRSVSSPGPRTDPQELLRRPVLLLVLAFGFIHGIALTSGDMMFSLHVSRLGLSPTLVGVGVATGVAAEILVMIFCRPLLARMRFTSVLALAVGAGVPRYWLMGSVSDPAAIIALQALHGLNFGAFWIAAVGLIGVQAPRGLAASAQALLPAFTFGAGHLASMSIAAYVLETQTTGELYQIMAGFSAAGALGFTVLWWLERGRS